MLRLSKFVLSLCSVMVLTLCIGVNSGEVFSVGDTYTVKNGEIHNVTGKEIIKFDSKEYDNFIEIIKNTVSSDVRDGFDNFISSVDIVIEDHIKLNRWGKFLYDYSNKSSTLMPLGDAKIPFGSNYIYLKGDRETKEWISKSFLPVIYDAILSNNDMYSCNIYMYEFQAMELEKFLVSKDSLQVKLLNSIQPFVNNELYFYSVGGSYGLQLNSGYIGTLNGLSDMDSTFRLLDRQDMSINVVNIFGVLATPKVEKGDFNFSNKKLSGMSLYEGVGVSLANGDTIKIASADGTKIAVCDEKFNKEDLYVLSLDDSVCVVPIKYKEAANISKYKVLTGVDLDISNYLLGNDSIKLSNGKEEKIDTYVSEDEVILSERDDKGNFLLFTSNNKIPFNRVVTWLVSDDSKEYFSNDEITAILKIIEDNYKNKGKGSEWDRLAKANGLKTDNVFKVKIVVGFVVLFGVVIIIFVVNKSIKGKKKSKFKKENLLFNIQEEEDDNYVK